MQIPVLVEPIGTNGFRARGAEPFGEVAEAPTPEEAVANLREQLKAKCSNGTSIVPLDIEQSSHPLAGLVGMHENDPWIDDWKQAMREHREIMDGE